MITKQRTSPKNALLVLGCPEIPVQMAIALYISYILHQDGVSVRITGNPSVLNLLRISDPKMHYISEMKILERSIGDIVDKKQDYDVCVVFAHNDAGISYAATIRHILPESRLLVVLFGRTPDELASQITFPCEMIIEKAVHNPMQLKSKINEVFGWDVSRT